MAENTNNQQPDAGVEFPAAGRIYTEEVAAFQQTFVRKLLAISAWILRNRAIEKLPALGRLKLQIENVTMGEILGSAGLQMRDDWDHNLSDAEKAWLTCDLGRSYGRSRLPRRRQDSRRRSRSPRRSGSRY